MILRDHLMNLLAVLLLVALSTSGGLWLLDGLRWRGGCTLAGHNHITFSYKKNSAAYLEYGRRMRSPFSFQVRAMCIQNADLIKKFRGGEYENRRDAFDTDTAAFCNALLESIEQFDGQQVPDVLEKPHAMISTCHRLCYESTQALREAREARGTERERLVREAEKKLKDAYRTGTAGVKLYNRIWARTST